MKKEKMKKVPERYGKVTKKKYKKNESIYSSISHTHTHTQISKVFRAKERGEEKEKQNKIK